MRGFKKCVGAVTAAAMLFTSVLPAGGLSLTAYAAGNAAGRAAAADVSVQLQPDKVSPFNDTNGDGLGEFEGWGTSLCWWANRLGYSEKMTAQAADVFFSENGLNMNIGRYNVGGGDNVGEVEAPPEIMPNEKATVYDLESERKPSYAGAKMEVSEYTDMSTATYTVSDPDYGFNKGKPVGNFKYIGWINSLSDSAGDGDKLNYKVNAPEAGSYTVKLLMMHNSNTNRDVAISVNEEEGNLTDESKQYVVSNDVIQQSKIISASGENQCLFLVTIPNVELNAGENDVRVAGKAGWTLDFVNMLVVKSDEAGVLPEEPDNNFLHAPHIRRSDSVVPGYCVDVTKIDTTQKSIEQYQQEFTRVDEECGYAWNYDWDADKRQVNILKAAIAANKASGSDFIAEAFSNSPPYFMTYSGCSSGNVDASQDNLRKNSYHAFASYMADVIVHWANEGIYFQSTTPMNEPYTSYWGANSAKQEGCHFDLGDSESDIIVALHDELERQAAAMEPGAARTAVENIIFSGTDETNIDTQIDAYKALSDEAKNVITRIDTHTYSGSKRTELSALAEAEGKNLWMSEIDGASKAGINAGEMAPALGFAQRIINDVSNLRCSAWIMWNAVDLNVDANNEFDVDTLEELKTTTNDAGEIMFDPANQGYWGLGVGDHNNQEIILTKKYEAYGQFSRYIRPGYTIIGSNSSNMLAAYDSEGKQAVIVAVNTLGEDKTWEFDLSRFKAMGREITAIRTSGTMEDGEKWQDVTAGDNIAADTANRKFTATMKANSITTYIVKGVEYDKAFAENAAKRDEDIAFMEEIKGELASSSIQKVMEEVPLDASMVTGSEPWNGGTVDVPANVVDKNFNSFFDGVTNGWVQINMGKKDRIAAIGYAPRSGYTDRCVNASIYGSNDGENWDLLYTIKSAPPAGKFTYAYTSQFKVKDAEYQYIKYAVPEGDSSANCNVAEIGIFRLTGDYSTVETLEELLAIYDKEIEGKEYAPATQKAYDDAAAEARRLNNSTDEGEVAAAWKALVLAYRGLREVKKETYNSISGVEGAVRRDTNGDVIQAHGGQIQQIKNYDLNGDGKITEDDTFWYWIGEDKTNDYRPCPGIHVYISKDLYNWEDKGCVLRTVPNWETFTTDEYFTKLYGSMPEEQQRAVYGDLWTADNSSDGGCVIERPKMLYNDKTKKYVIWFHADGQVPGSTGSNYAKAKAGVAISDSPFGPFQLQGSYLLNYDESADHGFDGEVGGHVRDMNLFKDDDGTGYVLYSSDGNQTMHIAKLNDEYTNVAQPDNSKAEQGVGKDFTRNFIGESREAPAMFKYNGKYYIITSGCTGWSPNRASYAVADHPMGPWTTVGDPCIGAESSTTFRTQSTCVFPVDAEKGQFIYMGDRWSNPDTGNALRDSRYVWLPVNFLPDNKIALRRNMNWSLEVLDLLTEVREFSEMDKSLYTGESWKKAQEAYDKASVVSVNVSATADEVTKAQGDLAAAVKALQTVKDYLQKQIAANTVADSQKGKYTADSWEFYQAVLKDAKNLLSQQKVTEEDAASAIKALADAKAKLKAVPATPSKKNQTISYTKSYTKAYGDKAFKLKATVKKGNGKLSFKSSNTKVASVGKTTGKVTIKGIGKCTITVTAAATSTYNKRTVSVSLTVNPKQAALSSVKAVKGKKMTVKWKRDSKATGYRIEYSLKKNFKGAKKVVIKKNKTTSTSIKKLTAGKKYYVRIRAYKTVKVNKKNVTLYGKWSKVKTSAKIKK